MDKSSTDWRKLPQQCNNSSAADGAARMTSGFFMFFLKRRCRRTFIRIERSTLQPAILVVLVLVLSGFFIKHVFRFVFSFLFPQSFCVSFFPKNTHVDL